MTLGNHVNFKAVLREPFDVSSHLLLKSEGTNLFQDGFLSTQDFGWILDIKDVVSTKERYWWFGPLGIKLGSI